MTPEARDLLGRLETRLEDDRYAADLISLGLICLEMAKMLSTQLSDAQRRAAATAQEFAQGRAGEAERLRSLEEVAAACDRDAKMGEAKTTNGYQNRLVFACLNTNTPLTSPAAEFIVDVGIGSGLDVGQIERAIRKVLDPRVGSK